MIELLLAISGAGMLLSILAGMRAPKSWLALLLTGAAGGLGAAAVVLVTGEIGEWQSALTFGGESVHLRLDALSALFLALLSLVGGAGALYAREYWSETMHRRSARVGRVWWSVLMLCLGLVLIVANGLHFLIAWELFTLAAYFLVTLDRRSREVRARAGCILARHTLLRFACSLSSHCWLRTREDGNSDRCATAWSSRRCSGSRW